MTLWVGSLWTVGYLVAPTLFAMLDSRALAGDIAGQLFSLVSWLGLLCGAMLIGLLGGYASPAALKSWRAGLVYSMLLITAVGEFAVLPLMQELKIDAGGEFVAGSPLQQQFAKLHMTSSALFVINSLLGLVLVVYGLVAAKPSDPR